jgi:hypothetical protein
MLSYSKERKVRKQIAERQGLLSVNREEFIRRRKYGISPEKAILSNKNKVINFF